MENKKEDKAKKGIGNFVNQKMTRKEAIKRTGFIAASAATMMILLSSPTQARGPAPSAPAPLPQNNNNNNGRRGSGPWH